MGEDSATQMGNCMAEAWKKQSERLQTDISIAGWM
jgi:hypothetical protein